MKWKEEGSIILLPGFYMKKNHDRIRSNLTYLLDDEFQADAYNFLQQIQRRQGSFISLLIHDYLFQNHDGQTKNISKEDAEWLYKWLFLKHYASDIGINIMPYKATFEKIVKSQPDASPETILDIYAMASVSTASTQPESGTSSIDSSQNLAQTVSETRNPSLNSLSYDSNKINTKMSSEENMEANLDLLKKPQNNVNNYNENDDEDVEDDLEEEDDDKNTLNVKAFKALSKFNV